MKKAIIIILIIALIGIGIYFFVNKPVVKFSNFKYGGTGIVPDASIDYYISYKGKTIQGTLKKDSPTASALSGDKFTLSASYEGGKYILAIMDSSGIVKGYEIDPMTGEPTALQKGRQGT